LACPNGFHDNPPETPRKRALSVDHGPAAPMSLSSATAPSESAVRRKETAREFPTEKKPGRHFRAFPPSEARDN